MGTAKQQQQQQQGEPGPAGAGQPHPAAVQQYPPHVQHPRHAADPHRPDDKVLSVFILKFCVFEDQPHPLYPGT